jgi:bacteriocin-like protein
LRAAAKLRRSASDAFEAFARDSGVFSGDVTGIRCASRPAAATERLNGSSFMTNDGLSDRSTAVTQEHAPMSELSDAELATVSGGEMGAVSAASAGSSFGAQYGSNFANFCYGER